MPEVKIYSTPMCPYCNMAKDYFDNKKIKYQEVDVSVDQRAAQEMVKKTGQMGVPVIEVDNEIVLGFDQAKLEEILSKK